MERSPIYICALVLGLIYLAIMITDLEVTYQQEREYSEHQPVVVE